MRELSQETWREKEILVKTPWLGAEPYATTMASENNSSIVDAGKS